MSLSTDQATAMRDQILQKLAAEHKGTIKVLEHVPDAKLAYTPHDKVRPFGHLAKHVYDVGHWFAGIMEAGKADFSGEAPKPDVPTSKAALLEACNRSNEELLGRVKSIPADKLAKDIQFGNFGSFPAVAFLDWHVSHMIHHRGQLTTYLRTMGAKVPAIYGDSADYPLSM